MEDDFNPGNFYCTVFEGEGRPVPGATATLGTEPPQTTVSNEAGQVRFLGLRAGYYTLDITLDGYKPAHHPDVRINAGRDTILELKMTPV
jgi:hypothetical protein